jgi:hypothetical protein
MRTGPRSAPFGERIDRKILIHSPFLMPPSVCGTTVPPSNRLRYSPGTAATGRFGRYPPPPKRGCPCGCRKAIRRRPCGRACATPVSPRTTGKRVPVQGRAWPGRLRWSAWRSCCRLPERLRQANADRPAGCSADEQCPAPSTAGSSARRGCPRGLIVSRLGASAKRSIRSCSQAGVSNTERADADG